MEVLMSAKSQASPAQPAGTALGSAGLSAFAVDWLLGNQQHPQWRI